MTVFVSSVCINSKPAMRLNTFLSAITHFIPDVQHSGLNDPCNAPDAKDLWGKQSSGNTELCKKEGMML